MKKNVIIALFLILGVALGIAIIDAGAKRPLDWTKTYDIRDKIPFGLFVLKEELPDMLGRDKTYDIFGESLYEKIDSLDAIKSKGDAILQVYEGQWLDESTVSKSLGFVKNGGELFISAAYFGEHLQDTLGLQTETLNYAIFNPTEKNVKYSLAGDTNRFSLDKSTNFTVFSKLDPKSCTILGYIHARGRSIPNFIKVKYGKGNIYMHTLPELFTNYYLLQRPTYDFARKTLHIMQNRNVHFMDYYYESEKPSTPLRVILTQPGLNQAWYLLLFGLAVLLLFKSKREQRAVPVIKPEPNLSRDFAMTIGNLYYENGDPGNIIHKKIEYFLFFIRNSYHLDTMDLTNEKFVKQLAAKSGVDLSYTKSLLELISSYKLKKHFHIDEVKVINQNIEEFKSKANII